MPKRSIYLTDEKISQLICHHLHLQNLLNADLRNSRRGKSKFVEATVICRYTLGGAQFPQIQSLTILAPRWLAERLVVIRHSVNANSQLPVGERDRASLNKIGATHQSRKPPQMSGQDGARGYLLQAMICVLDSLSDGSLWTSVTIEPNDASEKVDVIWTYPESRKSVQVKHSTNRIGLPDATRWAMQLENSIQADAYELRLLGPIADNLFPAGRKIGRVDIPIPETTNIQALRRHAAHNLDLYLTTARPPHSLRPIIREVIIDALCNRLGALSTAGSTFSRTAFDRMLQEWVNEVLLQSGYEATSQPSQQRLPELEQRLLSSHGRRIARWQAAGMSRDASILLSEDETLGALPKESLPNESSPLRLVVAPLGAGKSLAAERFFESSVRTSMQSVGSPIPVFIEARHVNVGLENSLRYDTSVLGDPAVNGVHFVVDGLDDLSARDAQRLFAEARVIVNSWPNSRAIMTSRSMRCWNAVEECVTVAKLNEASSLRLVVLSSSKDEGEIHRTSWSWSTTIKETIGIPLFAILLGKSMKDRNESVPLSKAGLVAHLVEEAVGSGVPNSEGVKALCRKLAADCLDRNGSVPTSELVPRNMIEQLLPTGLVVEAGGLIGFPLPVLTQWFAAQAIAQGEVAADSFWKYPGRIDRWRSAIAIAVGTESEETIERILTPIANRDPGFLMTVVDEATSHWTLDTGAKPPNAGDAARRLRNAMEACVSGIGDLAGIITPINPQTGRLFPTATSTSGEWLIAGWSLNPEDAEIAALPPGIRPPGPMRSGKTTLPGQEEILQFSYGFVRPHWIEVRGARPGRQSAWAWRWIANHIQERLKERLKSPAMFDLSASPLVSEAAWHSALSLLKLRPWRSEPISLKDIEAGLPLSLHELKHRSLDIQQTVVKQGWKSVNVTMLGLECARLEVLGATELTPPLPFPDRTDEDIRQSHYPWQWFSEVRTFERIRAVVESSVVAYVEIVQEWFAPMAMRLDRAATLPARIVVDIDMKKGDSGITSDPALRIIWEALPKDSKTEVVLQSKPVHFGVFEADACLNLQDQLVRLRPELAESLGVSICHSGSHDMFADFAVRTLVHKWLEDDLRKINWIA